MDRCLCPVDRQYYGGKRCEARGTGNQPSVKVKKWHLYKRPFYSENKCEKIVFGGKNLKNYKTARRKPPAIAASKATLPNTAKGATIKDTSQAVKGCRSKYAENFCKRSFNREFFYAPGWTPNAG